MNDENNINERTVWSYQGDVDRSQGDIIGYDVAASDGEIGSVEEETLETDRNRLVVDTGFWLFGTKRLVPAGAVTSIDHEHRTIHIDMTKEQVKSSPEYESAELYAQDLDPYTTYFSGITWARA